MLSTSLLVQEKIEDSKTEPPERAMLSLENHTQLYNIVVCVLGCEQGGDSKAIPVVCMKVHKIRKPKPNHIDWSDMLKLE